MAVSYTHLDVYKRQDSRLMKIEQSTDTKMPYVIIITNPLKTRQRITIPIDTSSHFLHKIQNNKMAGNCLLYTSLDARAEVYAEVKGE